MNYLKICSIVLSISLSSFSSYAQDDATENLNSVKKSMWAFQASDNFNAVILQLKYHTSNRTALRYGIMFNLDNGNGKDSQIQIPVDTIIGKGKSNLDNWSVSNRLDLLFYPIALNQFAFYSGFGPEVGLSRWGSHNNFERPNYSNSGRSISKTRHIALNGFAGIEWFPLKKVSVFTEYELFARLKSIHETYSWRFESVSNQEIWGSKVKRKDRKYEIGSNGMRLGLSLYW